LCNECVKYVRELKLERALRIDETDNRFELTVEATGSLPCEDIVVKAL